MPFVDSRHLFSTLDFFTLDSRLFSLDSRLLLSTLDFYSRLSTITLDSRHLLSTLDPRLLDAFRYTPFWTLCFYNFLSKNLHLTKSTYIQHLNKTNSEK